MPSTNREESPDKESSSLTPSPQRSITITLFSALIGALVSGGGVGAYFLWMNPSAAPQPVASSTEPLRDKDGSPAAYFFEIPDIIVNLHTTESKRRNFLKLKITLEVNRPEEIQALEKIRPRLIDQMQTYLRELTIADLEGAQGALKLRENLLIRIQTVASPVVVKQILFKDLLIQ